MDAGRVFTWGDSAGGLLALMAALTGAEANDYEGPGSGVQGVVAWFPVTDLAGLLDDVAQAAAPIPGRSPERRCSSAPRPGHPIWPRRRAR